jgi:hypothetical protein
MRILYDTNALVAMLSRRESILSFKKLLQDQTVHVSSSFILAEVEAVLVKKMKLTKQKAKVAARLFERQSTIVHPKNIEKICRDPFDDYVLAAAVTGKVDYLITADRDLLVLEKYKGIVIVTPRAFAALSQKSNQS